MVLAIEVYNLSMKQNKFVHRTVDEKYDKNLPSNQVRFEVYII